VAFVVGWLVYVSALFSAAAVVSGLSGHLASSWGLPEPWGTKGLAAACLLLLGGVAASGLRPSAVAWNLVTVLKLIPLLLMVVLFAAAPAPASPAVVTSGLGWESLSRGALIVVFALQGFEIVPVPAGKARHGRWAVPVATVSCLLLVAVLYAVLHWACIAALPELGQSAAPIVDAARVLGGDAVASLVSVGTGVSAVGIAFGMMAMTPRYLSVLGRRDGFGAWVGLEHAASHVPRRALVITVACVFTLVMWATLRDLFVLSSVAVLTQYAAVVASLAVLGWRGAAGLRRRQLWSVPLALGAILLLGRAAELYQLLVTAGVVLVGVVILLLRARGTR
jgi:amino acid transporter